MSKKQNNRFEKNIYVEQRCGAYRFKVVIYPLQDSATFSNMGEGVQWARRRRVELLERKALSIKSKETQQIIQGTPAFSGFSYPNTQPTKPTSIKLVDVFDHYENHVLPNLASKSTEASRLANLRVWFGQKNLEQLSSEYINKWMADRFSGRLGSGRASNRAETMVAVDGEKPLTKQQRYARKQAGKAIPSLPVYSVSSQTVRHELSLLRRAVTMYLKKKGRWGIYGGWWQEHDLMTMALPEAAEPRTRRVSDAELARIFSSIDDVRQRAAILFAILTSLRRSEIVSLQWEDVDFQRKVIRLKKPGFLTKKKTKTNAREIPLLPGAIEILQKLEPQKKGSIFLITAHDFSKTWRSAADKAKIYDVRLHDCRREAISRLSETCRLMIQEIVLFSGHSDIRTLEKHYLHLKSDLMASRLAELPEAKKMAPSL